MTAMRKLFGALKKVAAFLVVPLRNNRNEALLYQVKQDMKNRNQ